MALTVVAKPSGFQPVGGPSLLYQFTEATVAGKPNYRVELEFNGLFSGLKFEFRPTAALAINCEISKILYSALTLSTLTTDRLKSTYVKYQAVWDGGSDAVVSLSGDVIYAYVGINHDLNRRILFGLRSADAVAYGQNSDYTKGNYGSGPLLRHVNGIENRHKMVTNRTHYVEFLCDGSLPVSCRATYWFNNGATAVDFLFAGNVKALIQVPILITDANISSGGVNANPKGNFQVCDIGVVNCYSGFSFEMIQECSNPVYLQWVNDFGGLQDYMFDFNQALTLSPRVQKKLRIYTLYEDLLTYLEWLMMNELLRTSDTYNDDFKVGLFLQDITVPASPLNLITLEDDSNTVNTYAKGYPIQFKVKYPTINYN